jgi:hypothetical protein
MVSAAATNATPKVTTTTNAFSFNASTKTLTVDNLIVAGNTTTINSTTLTVDDKNIELGSVASPTDTTADGGGITLKGTTDKTIIWTNATNAWNFGHDIQIRLTRDGSATATTTSTTQTVLYSFAASAYGTAKLIIQATSATERHVSELFVTHDGTTAVATEYALVKTDDALFTTEVDISGGNVRILVTSASATSTVYKAQYTLIEA